MNLEGFIGALQAAGCDVDAEQLLDTFWLAWLDRSLSLHTPLADSPKAEAGSPATATRYAAPSPPVPPPPGGLPARSFPGGDAPAMPPPQPATTLVYARGNPSASDRTIKASPFNVPAGRALAGRLALMRALRPLSQRWPSRQYAELDEEATVEATAQLRAVLPQVMYPVFRPRRERWYDVELVLEDDAAIELWADTLRELAQALRETGAFRLVRSWRLRMPPRSGGLARPLLESTTGALMPAAHLVGNGMRRLVVFATHGSSSRWQDGSYAEVLQPWVRDDSVLLLQLMPPERWAQTRLGEPHGFASAAQAGARAASLKVHALWWHTDFDPEAQGLLTLPTVALQPAALNDWARMQMARGRQSPVYLLDPTRKPAADNASPQLATAHDFERAIGQLRRVSPQAFQLAVSLCTSVFTIPVARLVQAAKFDGSTDQGVLAELLQSGLVRARPSTAGEVAQFASTQYYEFKPEAQQLLVRSLRDADARQIAHEIRAQVSRYIEQISGSAVGTSQLVADEQGSYDLPEWAQPFAEVASALLGPPPEAPSAQAVFDAFERTQAASIVGATARLAASGRTLQPDAIEPALWQNLLSARLIHQNADGQWLFEPAIASLLVQLDEEEPLLGARILWVDDKPENNEREGERLQAWGAEVMHALDTDSALDTLRTRFIDIVISDMVRGTHYAAGLDLLQRMRAINHHMPFIVYAAVFAERSPQVALDAGAFGCTNERDKLYALVKAALRHESESVAAPVPEPSLMHKVLVSAGLAATRIDELLAKHPGNPVEIARELLNVGSSASACYTNHLRLIEAFAGSTVNQLIVCADEGLVVSAQVLADGLDARFSIASRDGLIGESAQSGQVVWASNVSLAARYIAAEPTTRSELVMPVFDQRRSSRVAAVVNVELPRTHALAGNQVEWLKAFVAPLNSYLPTHDPRTIIVFNERDRTSASNLASELSQAERRAELLHPPEGTNIHDALLLLASHASLTTPPTARVKCTPGRIVVCLDKPAAPLDHEDWPRVIDLYADHAEGLTQLVELLAPEGGRSAATYRPQAAKKAKATASSLHLEIHYATDRQPEPQSSGNLAYGSGRAERLSYGICEVSVPPNHHLGALERPSALRLQFRPNPAQHFMQLSNRPVTYGDFASGLLPPLSAAKPGLLLYVPGFNLDFEHSVLLAAQIKMDLVTETVLYSWPSIGKVTGFVADRETAEWAAGNLSALLMRLSTVSPRPIHLWADGLGAAILIAALADLRTPSQSFGQIILTRPTVDLTHFEATAKLLSRLAKRTTVYLPSGDLISSVTAGIQGRPSTEALIGTVRGVDIVNVSASTTSLGSLGANNAMLADIHALLLEGGEPVSRPGLQRSSTASGAHWALSDASTPNEAEPENTQTARPRIFISYVHRYARYAQAVVDALGNRAEVAWDKQLKAGDNFAVELARMLEQADAVVAVVGSLTVTSLFASHEIQRSLELGKRLIPVVVDRFKEPADLHKLMYANLNATGGPILLSEVAPEELEQVARTTADSILRAASGHASGKT